MEELKKFCNACLEEKDIMEIERDAQGVTFILSCGHKIIEDEFTDVIAISAQLKDKVQRPGFKKPIIEGMQRTKTSAVTKRPTRESYLVDRGKQRWIHRVWEQKTNGEWELVHDEKVPLFEKGK